MGLTYYQMKKKVEQSGKTLEINELAKQLQSQLSEPGSNISFKDAYEMAYNEMFLYQYCY
jgi:hypothetical protein